MQQLYELYSCEWNSLINTLNSQLNELRNLKPEHTDSIKPIVESITTTCENFPAMSVLLEISVAKLKESDLEFNEENNQNFIECFIRLLNELENVSALKANAHNECETARKQHAKARLDHQDARTISAFAAKRDSSTLIGDALKAIEASLIDIYVKSISGNQNKTMLSCFASSIEQLKKQDAALGLQIARYRLDRKDEEAAEQRNERHITQSIISLHENLIELTTQRQSYASKLSILYDDLSNKGIVDHQNHGLDFFKDNYSHLQTAQTILEKKLTGIEPERESLAQKIDNCKYQLAELQEHATFYYEDNKSLTAELYRTEQQARETSSIIGELRNQLNQAYEEFNYYKSIYNSNKEICDQLLRQAGSEDNIYFLPQLATLRYSAQYDEAKAQAEDSKDELDQISEYIQQLNQSVIENEDYLLHLGNMQVEYNHVMASNNVQMQVIMSNQKEVNRVYGVNLQSLQELAPRTQRIEKDLVDNYYYQVILHHLYVVENCLLENLAHVKSNTRLFDLGDLVDDVDVEKFYLTHQEILTSNIKDINQSLVSFYEQLAEYCPNHLIQKSIIMQSIYSLQSAGYRDFDYAPVYSSMHILEPVFTQCRHEFYIKTNDIFNKQQIIFSLNEKLAELAVAQHAGRYIDTKQIGEYESQQKGLLNEIEKLGMELAQTQAILLDNDTLVDSEQLQSHQASVFKYISEELQRYNTFIIKNKTSMLQYEFKLEQAREGESQDAYNEKGFILTSFRSSIAGELENQLISLFPELLSSSQLQQLHENLHTQIAAFEKFETSCNNKSDVQYKTHFIRSEIDLDRLESSLAAISEHRHIKLEAEKAHELFKQEGFGKTVDYMTHPIEFLQNRARTLSICNNMIERRVMIDLIQKNHAKALARTCWQAARGNTGLSKDSISNYIKSTVADSTAWKALQIAAIRQGSNYRGAASQQHQISTRTIGRLAQQVDRVQVLHANLGSNNFIRSQLGHLMQRNSAVTLVNRIQPIYAMRMNNSAFRLNGRLLAQHPYAFYSVETARKDRGKFPHELPHKKFSSKPPVSQTTAEERIINFSSANEAKDPSLPEEREAIQPWRESDGVLKHIADLRASTATLSDILNHDALKKANLARYVGEFEKDANVVANNLKVDDLTGIAKEMRGKRFPKDEGGYYDHFGNEWKQAKTSLLKTIDTCVKSIDVLVNLRQSKTTNSAEEHINLEVIESSIKHLKYRIQLNSIIMENYRAIINNIITLHKKEGLYDPIDISNKKQSNSQPIIQHPHIADQGGEHGTGVCKEHINHRLPKPSMAAANTLAMPHVNINRQIGKVAAHPNYLSTSVPARVAPIILNFKPQVNRTNASVSTAHTATHVSAPTLTPQFKSFKTSLNLQAARANTSNVRPTIISPAIRTQAKTNIRPIIQRIGALKSQAVQRSTTIRAPQAILKSTPRTAPQITPRSMISRPAAPRLAIRAPVRPTLQVRPVLRPGQGSAPGAASRATQRPATVQRTVPRPVPAQRSAPRPPPRRAPVQRAAPRNRAVQARSTRQPRPPTSTGQ